MRLTAQSDTCRLCGGLSNEIFRKLVLGRLDVAYFQCTDCGSQQTSEPSWLDEAYAIPGLHLDVGAPSRCIKNWLAAVALLKALEFPLATRGVDFGAGPGLFARLMRSSGYDFFAQDAFSEPLFANYFSVGRVQDANPEIITAFEVFEHLPNPRQTLDDLLGTGASLIPFTTWPLDGQDESWIYYLPDCGQHVFFYSNQALAEAGARHGYEMRVCQYFQLFFHPQRLSPAQCAAIEDFCLNSITRVESSISEELKAIIMGNRFIDADFELANTIFSQNLAKRKP